MEQCEPRLLRGLFIRCAASCALIGLCCLPFPRSVEAAASQASVGCQALPLQASRGARRPLANPTNQAMLTYMGNQWLSCPLEKLLVSPFV